MGHEFHMKLNVILFMTNKNIFMAMENLKHFKWNFMGHEISMKGNFDNFMTHHFKFHGL